MKLFYFGTALSAALISFTSCFPASASPSETGGAQQVDYDCFMITKSGQVVDLTESVCKVKKSKSAVSVGDDEAFIEDYKRTITNFPEVSDELLLSAQRSPEQGINQAKSVCKQLKEGSSLDEIKSKQAERMFQDAEVVNADVINTLAAKHYCPELSGQ